MKNNPILTHRSLEPENSILYIVGTPIGNLNDISSRALNILENVSLVACEDTRQTKKIMHNFNISNKLMSFNEHNAVNKIPRIIDKLNKGNSIALVSDAGMPGICDPGENLIKSVKKEGFDVICIPGACAAITALLSSGMEASSFVFEGFLPRKKNERDKILLEISKSEKTTILFESPYRLKKLLEELYQYCGGKRKIEVARELTKKFEEHICDEVLNLIEFFKDKEVIGEITIVISGTKKKDIELNKIELKRERNELISAGLSLSAASKYLAKKIGVKKSEIYNLN